MCLQLMQVRVLYGTGAAAWQGQAAGWLRPAPSMLPRLLVLPSTPPVTPCVRSTHPHILVSLRQAVAEYHDAAVVGIQHHLALAAAQLLHVQWLRRRLKLL